MAVTSEKSTELQEAALQQRVHAGYRLEDPTEMTTRYRDVLVNTVHIAADLEVVTLPTYAPAIRTAPTLEDKIAIAAACQDELGHAQVMYRILEEFGYDTQEFLFERDPHEWRTFQMLEFPHEDYIESVVSMCYGDRAGYITTVDLEENCSYAPLARSLRKVNFEETFHVSHGERWVTYFWNFSDEVPAARAGDGDVLLPSVRGLVRRTGRDEEAHRPDRLPHPRRDQRPDAAEVAVPGGAVQREGRDQGSGALRHRDRQVRPRLRAARSTWTRRRAPGTTTARSPGKNSSRSGRREAVTRSRPSVGSSTRSGRTGCGDPHRGSGA